MSKKEKSVVILLDDYIFKADDIVSIENIEGEVVIIWSYKGDTYRRSRRFVFKFQADKYFKHIKEVLGRIEV
mgnify:CR=1 FL=1